MTWEIGVVRSGAMAEQDDVTPTQMAFPYAAEIRLTKAQYGYATIRGRLPASFHDWQVKVLADGGSEADFKGVSRQDRRQMTTVTGRWNAMPAVQAQIEYERTRAIDARLEAPLKAWEAKMAKLFELAAGELPLVRTVVQVDEDGTRNLTVEEYHETNLTAMAKALEMEGRALAVFKDKTELSGPDGAAAIQVTFVRAEERVMATDEPAVLPGASDE